MFFIPQPVHCPEGAFCVRDPYRHASKNRCVCGTGTGTGTSTVLLVLVVLLVTAEEVESSKTGVTNSVGDMCNYVFNQLDLNYKDYVTIDERFFRAEELKYLRGDSTKLRDTFGWEPEYTFEALMDDMIQHWVKVYD